MKVKTGNCNPCQIIKDFWWIKRTLTGSSMKFEPNIPHNPYYIYKWTFSGTATTYNTREVYMTNYSGLSGNL